MNVGFVYTGATEENLRAAPELAFNLTDPPETIEAVRQALEAGGHTVIPLNTDRRLPTLLAETPLDIVFNIATGFYGDTRQANVPAMLEYLNIPHTGSGVLAETLTHHKHVMKALLLSNGLPTPPFQLLHDAGERLNPDLHFPLIVKLPSEGGSLGLTPDSVVDDEAGLRAQVGLLLDQYDQGALVEGYVGGREFTISVLGNNPPYALPIIERVYYDDVRIQLDAPEAATQALYQQLGGQEMGYTEVRTESVIAELSSEAAARIERMTIAAYQMLACRDWARIDVRMDDAGNPFILDVNLEPAIAPDYALAKAAYALGWTYTTLVNRILEHAIERYPHLRR